MADKIDLLRKKRSLLSANQKLAGFLESEAWKQLVAPRLESLMNQISGPMKDINSPAEAVKASQVGQITLLEVFKVFNAQSEIERLTNEVAKLEEEVKDL